MLKIAFPTDDGVTISAHLGRAPYYVVATLDGANAPQFEQRAKAYHGQDSQGHHDAHHDHNSMFAPLADCQVLIAGGMGQPAFDHVQGMGLKVLLTGEPMIAAALEACRRDQLVSDMRRVHAHR
jgi:predicted Fe-Mo cluster-binding NifX family protein